MIVRTIRRYRQEHIILFVLPAHTGYLLQPLGGGCFLPYETIFNVMSHKFIRVHCGDSRDSICSVACKAYPTAVSPQSLQYSYMKYGIFQNDQSVIQTSQLLPATVVKESANSKDVETTTENAMLLMVESAIKKSNNSIRKERTQATL